MPPDMIHGVAPHGMRGRGTLPDIVRSIIVPHMIRALILPDMIQGGTMPDIKVTRLDIVFVH